MLRSSKHLIDYYSYLGNYRLGNCPGIEGQFQNATNNTITFWFKPTGIVEHRHGYNYIGLGIKSGYWYGDESGTQDFIIKGDHFYSADTYYSVICKNRSSTARFHISLDKSRVPNYLGIKVITLNDDIYNEYEFTCKSGYTYQLFDHAEISKTEDYKNYNSFEPEVQYSGNLYGNSTKGFNDRALYNKSWIFQDTQDNLLGSKSIAIPKWLHYITIEATGIKAPNDPEKRTPFKCISYDGINNLVDRIKLYDTNHYTDNIVYKTNESDLVYDGEDYEYRYYHIVSVTNDSTANNLLSIIGSVKKNFRVFNQKYNIFYSHLLLNNTILFTKGVTINMLRSLKNLAREITRVENKVGAPKILTNVQYYQGVYNYADLYLNVGNSTNAKLMFDIFGGYNYFNNTGYMKCISANLNEYNITKCIENCMVSRDFFISIPKKVTDTTVCVRIHATEKHPDTDTNTKYLYIQITNINDYNILELEKIEYGYMDRSKFKVIPMLTGDFSEIWDTRNSNPDPAENDIVYIEDVLNICWPTYNSVKEYNPSNKPDRYFYPSRYYTQQVKKNFKVFGVLLAKNNKSKRIKSSYNNFIKEVA